MRALRPAAFLTVLITCVTLLPAQQPPAAGGAAPSDSAVSQYALETGKMWTFDVPPLDYWARRYGFRPSQEWLDHARLSAVRYSSGCSASFVSAEGLVMTNHHCARSCLASASPPEVDYNVVGFYAAAREQEPACRGQWLDQLLGIEDVSASVTGRVPAGTPPARAVELRRQAMDELERRCSTGPEISCQVVTMYRGGQYKLYRFRRYSDVRLVFAPEEQTAFFGGDPDNFTYPRHDLDVSFVRAYENGRPANTSANYFRFSAAGASEGDLVFVIGNPGSTGRLNTMAQLEYLRDVQYPATLAAFARLIPVYQQVSAMSEAQERAFRNQIFGLQNSQKAITGYQSGLLDPRLMARKREWERSFRQRVQADPNLRRLYGDAWDNVAAVRRELAQLDVRRRYHSFGAYGSRLLGLAGLIVRHPAETAKPDSARLAPYRAANRAALERNLYSAAPLDTALEVRLLAAYLGAMAADLPANDPVRRAALAGRSPEEAARAMVGATGLSSVDARRILVEGGAAALAASSDPFIGLARVVDPLERSLSQSYSELNSREAENDERLARALLAVYGSSIAPDATFSLRISDGEVRRYRMNGTFAPPFTTFHGLYDRSAAFGSLAPWNLPRRWVERRDSLNLATPLNLVSTNDIIGGNSGSPLINRDGEIVGLIFDGNIEQLPTRFLFSEETARTVSVDTRGIHEALRRVYGASALAEELARRN